MLIQVCKKKSLSADIKLFQALQAHIQKISILGGGISKEKGYKGELTH